MYYLKYFQRNKWYRKEIKSIHLQAQRKLIERSWQVSPNSAITNKEFFSRTHSKLFRNCLFVRVQCILHKFEGSSIRFIARYFAALWHCSAYLHILTEWIYIKTIDITNLNVFYWTFTRSCENYSTSRSFYSAISVKKNDWNFSDSIYDIIPSNMWRHDVSNEKPSVVYHWQTCRYLAKPFKREGTYISFLQPLPPHFSLITTYLVSFVNYTLPTFMRNYVYKIRSDIVVRSFKTLRDDTRYRSFIYFWRNSPP